MRSEPAKISAWMPMSLEMLRELEPVHVEGGRCALMAAAHEDRRRREIRKRLQRMWSMS